MAADAPIVLIGPPATGKSTLGPMVAERLGRPHVSLDEARWDYYREIGYDEAFAAHIRATCGFAALAFFWKQFDVYAVERAVVDYSGAVIDFGAGHSTFESTEALARARTALAGCSLVVLILPSPDEATSIRILRERTRALNVPGVFEQPFDWVDYFVRHPTNRLLATHTVYTDGRRPTQSCDEIVTLVERGR